MNKKRMGQFLRSLRNEKDWSQEEVSNKFSDNCFDVSIKAISDWENGKTIPEIEKLEFLSKLYGITIDEILDGDKLQDKNYYEEYISANQNRYQICGTHDDFFKTRQEQKIKVRKRFKELLTKKIRNDETKNEDSECRFLFEHFYTLSDYANEYVHTDVKDGYLRLKEAIRNKKLELGKDAKEEVLFFEVSKFIKPTDEISLCLNEIVDELSLNKYIDKRFKLLEWWEKDMLLMSIQQGGIGHDPTKCSVNYLKIYESLHGKEFNANESVRNAVRYMIENGACLNYQFINIILKKKIKTRIIDRIEELYLLCKKPIECSYTEDGKTFTRYVENNRKNRFVVNSYYSLISSLIFQNSGLDELYDFVWRYNPDDISDDLLVILAKKIGINMNLDMKYIRAEFNSHSDVLNSWKEYRAEEKEIEERTIELNKLEEILKHGEIYEIFEKEEYIGGKDFSSMMDYFEYWKTLVSLDELKKMRDKDKTKELLENLDSFSLEDIRNIYLKEEIREEDKVDE